MEVLQGNRIGRIHGARANSYTAGVICEKVGRYAERIHHPDRLTHPLLRTGPKGAGQFRRIAWDEALDRIAERFLDTVARFGSEAVWPVCSSELGQAFQITQRHILKDRNPPPYVALYMTFDWGFGKPFSIGWWWVDHEDRLYRFAEWYGWNGVEEEGLRMPDSAIAEGILERENKLGISGRHIVRLAGPDCWNKKADYRGGGQGPSTAEVFQQKGIVLRPGDPNRVLKIRRVP